VENSLAAIADLQDIGRLWVAPIRSILDWMIDLEKITIQSQSVNGSTITTTVRNDLDRAVKGVTLVASGPIREATIAGVYQIYVDQESLVLPTFDPGETKTVDVVPGTYNEDIPRLVLVATDVNVLKAEYDSSTRAATMIVEWTGTGLSAERTFSLQCGHLGDWLALLDGDQVIATIAQGNLYSENEAYQVSYDTINQILTFTLPSLTVPRTIVLQASSTPPTSADFNKDGDVDAEDFERFKSCISGPGVPYAPGCGNKDLDQDGDVDQSDFGILQRCYSGSGNPADPNCVN
jgi:hypothetical protein